MVKEIIKSVIERVCKDFDVESKRIVLFGSRARGDQEESSDWDILVVIDRDLSLEVRRKITHLIRKELAQHLIDCDILIRSEFEVEKKKDETGSVIKTVLREGIDL